MVSIVIPTHNRKDVLRDCLLSIRKTTYPNFEIIVVDAASIDGTSKMVKKEFPKVRLVEAGDIWHGESQNLGIMSSRGELVVSLEDDYVVEPKWLDALVKVISNSEGTGVVGGKVYFFRKGKLILSAGGRVNLFTGETASIGNKREDSPEYNFMTEVDYVPVPLTRREVFSIVGLWDPNYCLLFDEVDFCYRVRKHGYKVLYVPDATLWHKVNLTDFSRRSSKRIYYFFRNRIRFILKNFPLFNAFTALIFSLLLASMLIIFFSIIRKKNNVKALLTAITWNITNLKQTIIARIYSVQSSRKRVHNIH